MNEEDILAGVVTLENQYTRLLVNLINADSEFAVNFISLTRPELADQEIKTSDQPILAFENKRFCPDMVLQAGRDAEVLVEVKISALEKLRPSQLPGGIYHKYSASRQNCSVGYLLPFDYGIPPELEHEKVVYWHQLISHISPTSSLLRWLRHTLQEKFGPVSITGREVEAMSQDAVSLGQALQLFRLVAQLRNKVTGYQRGPAAFEKDAYGFYIDKTMFVGIWQPDASDFPRNRLIVAVQSAEHAGLKDRGKAARFKRALRKPPFYNNFFYADFELKEGDTAEALWTRIRGLINETCATPKS